MQTAQRIDFVGHDARNVADQGGLRTVLTVNFRVVSRGPAHVAGVIFTTDFWATTGEAKARFHRFEGNDTGWQVVVTVPGNNVSFEYVIFCDDFRGNNTVPRVWNTNGGE